MDTFHLLLQLSIIQYQKIFDRTEAIGKRLNKLETKHILSHLKELNILLDEAKNTDEEINSLLSSVQMKSFTDLYQERLSLMQKFLELNNFVASKIKAKMAVSLADINKIKSGRMGVSGYQSSIKKPTRFVNKSI